MDCRALLKTRVENSFSWGVASTHEITETWGYSIGVGEDKVVFIAIPFGPSESGTSSIMLEGLVFETEDFEYELNVDVEAEITAGGITTGLNFGYNYGYSYCSTVTTETSIEGEVPDIPPTV